jgi:hypothetical protein
MTNIFLAKYIFGQYIFDQYIFGLVKNILRSINEIYSIFFQKAKFPLLYFGELSLPIIYDFLANECLQLDYSIQ